MIQSMLGQSILIRVGKFESDRLSVEVKRLWKALEEVTVDQEKTGLLLECRALAEQLIEIVHQQERK